MELRRDCVIPNELGLHARAAAKIVQLAEKAQASVYIGKDGEEADAASLLDIIGLYCPQGTRISIRITDPGDTGVLHRIISLVEEGFGES